MGTSYTTRLTKRLPAAGDGLSPETEWTDDWHDNEKIDEVVLAALLSPNRLISGGAVTAGAGRVVNYAACKATVAGVTYAIIAGSKTGAAAPAGQEVGNWLYVNNLGVVTLSSTPPAGDFVPLARFDTSPTLVLRIADLRPQVADSLGVSGSWLTAAGTANALTLTTINTRPVAAYVDGAQYRFKAAAANTGAATLAIDGLAAKALRTITGVALPADYIRAAVETVVRYDAAADVFIADRLPERGSNANGDYVRYANGLQTCGHLLTFTDVATALGAFFVSPIMSWTFPAAFAGNWITVTGADASSTNIWTVAATNALSASARLYAVVTIGTSRLTRLSAVGLWY